ncbi:aminoglycoside phosphotransferase family protein [Nonomuraea fuscirosea]|uniref:aminoglycoside phosphotransferase family protein n=1 Tax=Nonomuraea fuscirosea TaxID=1291556 RepID=UPI00342C1CB1
MVATLLHEIPLQGGDVTDGVVRVGDTVRRPASTSTPAVHAMLRHLEAAGFDGAPRVVGMDGLGREILTYLPGTTGLRLESVSDEALAGLALLVRRFHDATAGFPLTMEGWEGGSNDDAEPEVIGHCDLTPDNVVFWAQAVSSSASVCASSSASAVSGSSSASGSVSGSFSASGSVSGSFSASGSVSGSSSASGSVSGSSSASGLVSGAPAAGGGPYGMIDFDLARPTTRLFDIVTTLRHWAPIADPVDRAPLLRTVDVGARLRLFCDAYGVSARERRRLLGLARLRFHRSYAVMRTRAAAGGNWAKMWAGGAGARIRRAAAWLDVHEDELHAHLV